MANMEVNKQKNKKAEKAAQGTDTEHVVIDQQKFLEILTSLVEQAKKKKNMLEYQEINDAFHGMNLTPEQLENILDYMEVHNVDVLRISDDDDDILIDDDDDVEV